MPTIVGVRSIRIGALGEGLLAEGYTAMKIWRLGRRKSYQSGSDRRLATAVITPRISARPLRRPTAE
jgi:hypothetical protein